MVTPTAAAAIDVNRAGGAGSRNTVLKSIYDVMCFTTTTTTAAASSEIDVNRGGGRLEKHRSQVHL